MAMDHFKVTSCKGARNFVELFYFSKCAKFFFFCKYASEEDGVLYIILFNNINRSFSRGLKCIVIDKFHQQKLINDRVK